MKHDKVIGYSSCQKSASLTTTTKKYKSRQKKYKSRQKKYKSKLKWINFGSYFFSSNSYFVGFQIRLISVWWFAIIIFLISNIWPICSLFALSLNYSQNAKEDSGERNSQKRKAN